MYNFEKQQRKPKSGTYNGVATKLYVSTLLISSVEYAMLVVTAADSHMKSFSFRYPVPAHPFYKFCQSLLPLYFHLWSCTDRQKVGDGVQPVSFNAYLNITLENTGTHMSLGLIVFYKLGNFMHTFTQDGIVH